MHKHPQGHPQSPDIGGSSTSSSMFPVSNPLPLLLPFPDRVQDRRTELNPRTSRTSRAAFPRSVASPTEMPVPTELISPTDLQDAEAREPPVRRWTTRPRRRPSHGGSRMCGLHVFLCFFYSRTAETSSKHPGGDRKEHSEFVWISSGLLFFGAGHVGLLAKASGNSRPTERCKMLNSPAK